jgi:phasin family protein
MEQNWSTLLTSVAEANEKAVAAATEFNRIAARAQARFARRQFVAFEDCLDAGSEHLAAVTAGDDPQKVMSRHAEIAAKLGEKLVAASQEALEIQVEARDELAGWMEKGVNTMKADVAEVATARPTARTRKPRRTTRKSA